MLTDPPDGSRVAVATADVIELVIPQNAGTGYVWSLVEHGEGLEVATEQDAVARGEDGADAAVPGGAGRHEVRLLAVRSGTWTVRLVCRRPWEDTALDERRLTVVVT